MTDDVRVNVKKLNRQWLKINGFWVTSTGDTNIAAIKVEKDGSLALFKAPLVGSLADSMARAELFFTKYYIGNVSAEGFIAFLGSQKVGEDAHSIYESLKMGEEVGAMIVVDYTATEGRAVAFIAGAVSGALECIGYEHIEEFQDRSYFHNEKGQYIEYDNEYLLGIVKMAASLDANIKFFSYSVVYTTEEV